MRTRRTTQKRWIANALQGKRIGVARFLAGYHGPTDAAFELALAELKEAGAELVDIAEFPSARRGIGAQSSPSCWPSSRPASTPIWARAPRR